MLAMAAGLVIFLLGGTYLTLERLPYSYVSIDVNPSMEYTLNWFDRVLSLRAVNEDAKPIAQYLAESGAVNQPIDRAVIMTIQKLNDMRYFENDTENDVVIAVASFGLKDVNRLSGTLKDSAGSVLMDHVLEVTSIQTDTGKVNEAQKYHTTAGKLVIVEDLAQSENGLADDLKEEWLEKPVREILKQKNGKSQPNTDEKNTGKPEHAANGMDAEGNRPEGTETPSTNSPVKTKTPKDMDVPTKKQDQPNAEKDKKTDAVPSLNNQDKPKNTPAPKEKEKDKGTKASPPGKGDNGGQEKIDVPKKNVKDPLQPSKGGGNQKGNP